MFNPSFLPYFTDIWIIGDSLIKWAEDRAIFRNNYNLGVHDKRLIWSGYRGMHLDELLPKLQHNILFYPVPAMIIIHVGGSDLVNVKQAKLMKSISKVLKYIAAIFPSSYVVWSDILPRKQWRGIKDTPANLVKMHNKRKRINRAGRQTALQLPLGRSVINYDIDTTTDGLFRSDGTHLSPIGNDIFLTTLQEAIASFLANQNLVVFNALA